MTFQMLRVREVAAVVGPIPLLLVPKCPLCLLALLAASGVAAQPTIIVTAILAAVIAGWEVFLFRVTHSSLLRACGVISAALLIAGRAWSLAPLTYVAISFMVTVGFVTSRRCREQKKG